MPRSEHPQCLRNGEKVCVLEFAQSVGTEGISPWNSAKCPCFFHHSQTPAALCYGLLSIAPWTHRIFCSSGLFSFSCGPTFGLLPTIPPQNYFGYHKGTVTSSRSLPWGVQRTSCFVTTLGCNFCQCQCLEPACVLREALHNMSAGTGFHS